MSLEGVLADFSIQEIVQLFSISKKTGVVKFRENQFFGEVAFENGLVYFAQSSSESGSIAERLVRERKLSAKSLRQAQGLLKIKKDENKTLFDILIENNFIDKKDLELGIKNAIMDAIFEIGQHTESQFVFFQDEKIEDELAIAKLDYDEIESELMRRQKTWEAILKKIPDFSAVYTLSPEAAERASEIRLKPLEWKVLCYMNGENTLNQICELLGISAFKAGKTVYGLLAAGLIQPLEVSDYIAEEYFAESSGEG